MSIIFARTGEVAQGKMVDAVQWAAKVTEYLNKTLTDTKVEVLDNVTGRTDQVHWVMRAESLAHFEKLTVALEGDKGYQALIEEVTKAGVFTKVIDHLYRVIG